jgi:hypothetical protein
VDAYQRRIAGNYIAHAQNYGFFRLPAGHLFESVDSKMTEACGEIRLRDFS